MTDTKLLLKFMDDSGMTKKAIAEHTGIKRGRLYLIIGGSDATASEIEALARVLRLTNPNRDRVFFAKKVEG